MIVTYIMNVKQQQNLDEHNLCVHFGVVDEVDRDKSRHSWCLLLTNHNHLVLPENEIGVVVHHSMRIENCAWQLPTKH